MSQTNIVILLCVLVSLFVWGADAQVVALIAFSTEGFFAGRIWTPATTLLVHATPLHLLGNMLFLFVFGNTLENAVNGRNLLLVFLAGGVATSLLSIPFYPADTLLVGASGAIFTLAATVMLIRPLKFSWLFLLPVGLVAILYFLYNILAVYYGFSGGVAYISHIIGFLIGLPFGIAWSQKWMRNLALTLGLLAIYLIVIAILAPAIIDITKRILPNL
nr:rhomboid family intramembrane serine protease [Candidatus Njordarchaeum guaymaensis]